MVITISDKDEDVCDVDDVFKKTDRRKCEKQETISQASADRHSNKGSIRLHPF